MFIVIVSLLTLGLVGAVEAVRADSLVTINNTFEFPGITNITNMAINNAGQVIAEAYGSDGSVSFLRDTNGIFSTLDAPGAVTGFTSVAGINNLGQIVGSYYDGQTRHGLINTNGVSVRFDAPGAASTGLRGVNDVGQLIGTARLPPQDTGPAFNFLYTNGAFTTLPPVYFADPAAINNLGQILYSAAWTPYNDVQRSSLLYVNGQFDAIRVPGSSLTSALGINNVGQIVGWSIGGGPNFVYAAGLYSRLRFPDEDGLSYSVYGINDAGQIVGSFSDGTTDHGFIGTIIPEASSSILIALGLTVIVVNCRMNRGRLRSQ